MVQDEPDFTRTAKVIQNIPPDARILAYGQDYGISFEDEGTEGNASEYTTYQGASVSDELGVFKVGSKSLRYTCPPTEAHGQAYRPLSTSFYWREFVTSTLYVYRTSGEFDAEGDSISLGFRASSKVQSAGVIVDIDISADPVGTWTLHTITKADFNDYYGGITQNTLLKYMFFYNSKDKSDPSDHCYLDGLYIAGGLGVVKPMAITPTGKVRTDTDIVSVDTGLEPEGFHQLEIQTPGVGGAKQLAPHPCKAVLIRAYLGNAGSVYLGSSLIDMVFELLAGEWLSSPCSNTNQFYFYADNADDGITYYAVN